MRCKQCGHPLERALDVCLFCGARSPVEHDAGASGSPLPKKNAGLKVVDGVIQPLRPYESDFELEQQRLQAQLMNGQTPFSPPPAPPHRSGNGNIPGLKRVDGLIQPLRPYQNDAPPPTAPPGGQPVAGVPVFQPPQPRPLRNGGIPGVKMVDGVIQPLRPYQGVAPAETDPTLPPERPQELLRDLPLPPAGKPQLRQNGRIPGVKMVDGVIQPLRPYQGVAPAEKDPTLPPERPQELLQELPVPPAAKPQLRQNGRIPGVKMVDGVIQPLRPYQGAAPTETDPTLPPERPQDLLQGIGDVLASQGTAAPQKSVRESGADLERVGGVIQPLRPYREDVPPKGPEPWENWKPLDLEKLDGLEDLEAWTQLFR